MMPEYCLDLVLNIFLATLRSIKPFNVYPSITGTLSRHKDNFNNTRKVL